MEILFAGVIFVGLIIAFGVVAGFVAAAAVSRSRSRRFEDLEDLEDEPARPAKRPSALPASPPKPTPRTAPPPSAPSRPFRWVPAGEAVRVAGYDLPGGLLYVGRGLRAIAPYRDVEPALIDPSLPVQRSRHESRTGEGMGYWPTYAGILPAHRAGFLFWLARGRSEPEAYIGYVFLYFYGLERRALNPDPGDRADAAELATIVAEVARLRDVYASNGSFAGYASRFLEFCRARASGPIEQDQEVELFTQMVPPSVRIRLGRCAEREVPVPPQLAFVWAANRPQLGRRTPAVRCEAELRELFAIRYAKMCGPGVVLANKGKPMSVEYQPASPGFGGTLEHELKGVRDVTRANVAMGETLSTLVTQCVDDLDPYSRWLGRNADGDGKALAGVSLLPAELLQKHGAPALADLRRWLQTYVPADKPLLTGAAEILARWQPVGGDKLPKGEATALLVFLEKLGFGIEPDLRFGGPGLTRDMRIALFRTGGEVAAPNPEYLGITSLLRFAAAVAGADGVSDDESGFLHGYVSGALPLSAAERRRLAAHIAWLLADPPGTAGLKKAAEAMTPRQRDDVGRFLVSVAGADGTVSRPEIKMLLKIFDLLGLPEEAVYSQVNALGGSAPAPPKPAPMQPVVVRPAGPPEHVYAIPPRPAPPPPAGAIQLDMGRVQSQMAESARVSAMLADIFRGEDEPAPPTPIITTLSIAGLDGLHSTLLRRLETTTTLSRSDWSALCQELGVLPDGAIDTLNEAALDTVGDPLLYGDDPIHLDPEVFRSLPA